MLLIGDVFLIQAVQKAKEKKETTEGRTCEYLFNQTFSSQILFFIYLLIFCVNFVYVGKRVLSVSMLVIVKYKIQ